MTPARSNRFTHLQRERVAGVEVPVAAGARARLLGLAFLEREAAGAGLLIRRCSSVHTFGMRFDLDLVFLDRAGRAMRTVRGVGPGRIVSHRAASSVLELPAAGGEPPRPTPGVRPCFRREKR